MFRPSYLLLHYDFSNSVYRTLNVTFICLSASLNYYLMNTFLIANILLCFNFVPSECFFSETGASNQLLFDIPVLSGGVEDKGDN